MITIGIDPGIERTGVGIVEVKNNKLSLLYKKLIKTSSKMSTEVRLNTIYKELNDIISNYKINFASVEKLFFAKNVKTALTVSEARGVILLTLHQAGINIFEYTPLQVKQGLIGYGRAKKNQIQDFLKIILNLKDDIISDDVADGIAMAVVHINTFKTMSKIKKFYSN